jgi:hypothetical protein
MTTPRPTAWLVWCVCVALPVRAAGQEQSAAAWRQLTAADVEAAYGILANNHPGAAPAAGDSAFRRTLTLAGEAARTRAQRVNSYEGWLATLRAFAAAFSDPHIMLQTRLSVSSVRWPGLVVGRQGSATVVISRDSTWPDLPSAGARLVSCDGTEVERLSRERLGVYRGTWEITSQQVRNTPFLLVDDHNPFLPPLSRCVFRGETGEREIALQWRSVGVTALQERLRDAAPVGRAGFGVRRVGDGWWIGLQALTDLSKPVLDSVAAHLEAMHAAPWVVVDVRGNGGGNSAWAVRLANQLVGDARVSQAMRRAEREFAGPLCGTSWRASAAVEEMLERYIRNQGPGTEQWRRDLDSVRAARAAGRDLGPMPRPCPPAASAPAGELPPPRMKGRLVLLTDHVCFSSCLLMAGLLRVIGATQVGEATDFSTNYMEVRGLPLPSGLGSLATLQKVAFGAPARLGPFDPEVLYPGRIDDTPALERWIVETVMKR